MKKKIPYVTCIVGLICVLIYILQLIGGYADSANGMILFGGYYKPFIIAGEYWRLITVAFVHANVWHLLINMMSLFSLGSELEFSMKRWKYLVLLFGSTLGGCAFLFVCQGNVLAVGISGGLYGLMCAYCILIYRAGCMKIPSIRNAMIMTIIINLLINFMPGVSWVAHFGGAITGFFLTEILIPGKLPASKTIQKNFLIAGIVMAIAVTYFGVQNAEIASDQVYLLTDYAVLNEEKKYLPDSYVKAMAGKLDQVYATGTILEDALNN